MVQLDGHTAEMLVYFKNPFFSSIISNFPLNTREEVVRGVRSVVTLNPID